MEDYVSQIVQRLNERGQITSEDLSIPQSAIHGVLLSMESRGQISFEIQERFSRVLTGEGSEALEHGSQEYNLFSSIPEEGADIGILGRFPLGTNYAFRNRWIRADGERVYRLKPAVEDSVVKQLGNLSILDEKDCNELRRRRLVEQHKSNLYVITKGARFGLEEDGEAELTSQTVADYRGQRFKKYNFDSVGNIPSCGSLHPLMKIKEEFRRIFLEMGFSEMRTSRYVESSFWNFDSLFQPQNHPSRDVQDTFFLKTPELTKTFEIEYFENVRSVHINGGYGSIGHQSVWNREDAMKNVLRTHTTAISSRYLREMARDFKPAKLFSIDKVFRNESVDATHLAEFHQVEGVVAGYGLCLKDLMGFMSTFFEKLGLKNIKFKPAFNPYTEPSMEVFGFHEGLGRWIEIGNSGMFRPEMLGPMGLDKNVTVIGWGLSLERPAMIKYGLSNIRDLVGHKVDINFIKRSEFVCL